MHPTKILGKKIIVWMEDIGLFIVAISTFVAIAFEVRLMFLNGQVTIADLLLLFIYLEILAMVGIYLESEKLPVRYPLYIAIVALARYLMLDMKNMDTLKMLGISGAAFILSLTILAIRYGHLKFPYITEEKVDENKKKIAAKRKNIL